MKPFRFGIAIAATEPPEVFVQTVKLAEGLGFDSIWIPDFRLYLDLYVSLALAALNTTRVRLGSAVTNPYTRHPGMTAVGIASVDLLSGGRAALGLATGGIVLNLLKIERRRQVLTCRNAVEEIRRYLGGDGTGSPERSNEHVRLDLPTRPGLPIIIGATGHQMLALAGEIADGVIVNVGANQECLTAALAAVEKGVRRVKRPPESLEKLCWLQGTAVSEDAAEAINLVKPTAALTLGRLPDWALEAMQMDKQKIGEIHRTYHREGADAAAGLVTDEMIERFTIAGTPEKAIGKLRELQKLGFDEFIFIVEESGGNVRTAIKTLAEKVLMELK
jgi:5,10-methylenetetrahydromethanopterin reductase